MADNIVNKIPPADLGFDLVRVTEAAALAAGRWLGRGDPISADSAAAEAMYEGLNTVDINGRIVIGEEGKVGRHSPLDSQCKVGTGNGPLVDVVVDPVDGVKLLSEGRSGAISVIGVGPVGSMWHPHPAVYMEKIVVDRQVAPGLVPECLDAPAAWTLALIARLKKKPVSDLLIFMLERPRHKELIREIRATGARVWLRADGDIAGALVAASPNSDIDAMFGTGGVPEGVIAACGIKALDGAILGRLNPQSSQEKIEVQAANLNTTRISTCNQLITSDEIFFVATGVTDGFLLKGARYYGDWAETQSLVLRASTGTHRLIHTDHSIKRLFRGLG